MKSSWVRRSLLGNSDAVCKLGFLALLLFSVTPLSKVTMFQPSLKLAALVHWLQLLRGSPACENPLCVFNPGDACTVSPSCHLRLPYRWPVLASAASARCVDCWTRTPSRRAPCTSHVEGPFSRPCGVSWKGLTSTSELSPVQTAAVAFCKCPKQAKDNIVGGPLGTRVLHCCP